MPSPLSVDLRERVVSAVDVFNGAGIGTVGRCWEFHQPLFFVWRCG